MIGKISQIMGPVVDVDFEDYLPSINEALIANFEIDGQKKEVVLEAMTSSTKYKNKEAFNCRNTVCYIPELTDIVYTREKIVEECFGMEWLAELVFNAINWQHPSTYLEELSNSPDILGEKYDLVFNNEGVVKMGVIMGKTLIVKNLQKLGDIICRI